MHTTGTAGGYDFCIAFFFAENYNKIIKKQKGAGIMLKKAFALFLGLIILSSLMCACQRNQVHDEESTENSTDTSKTVDTPEWKTAYLNFLEQKKDSCNSYALVYIDGDDIPELYLSGVAEAIGDCICTYKNGAVIEQQLNRIGGGWYIEKSGKIINQNGNMGHIYTHIYKLNKDGFALTFEALSVERVEVLENDDYKLHYEYSIGDNSVNESEYNSAIEAAFDFKNAVRLNENKVNYDTIRQQIIDFN